MPKRESIGVRQLKNEASRIINEVRERQAEYVVTRHGVPVAEIKPAPEPESPEERRARVKAIMQRLQRLAMEVAKHSVTEKSASELVSEGRR